MRRRLALASLFLESDQSTITEIASFAVVVVGIDGVKERMWNSFAGIDWDALAVRGGEGGRVGEGQVRVGGPADEEVLQEVGVAGEAKGEFVGC